MKYFLSLVQEMEVKIPAPVCEVVAHVATAMTSFPSVVLPGEFDSESRCLASAVLFSHPSYSPLWASTSTHWRYQLLPLFSPAISPASSAPLHSSCNQKGESTETQPNIIEVFVGPVCPCESA